MNESTLIALGYDSPRLLPSGEWAALLDFLFTTAVVVGIGELGYRTRFCYPSRKDAATALETWDGAEDPPGPWIKEKGPGADRSNPRSSNPQSATFREIEIIQSNTRRT